MVNIQASGLGELDSGANSWSQFKVEFEGKTDPDDVMESVGRAFKPHCMSMVESARPLDAAFRSLKLGNLSLYYLQYGAEVNIDPGSLDDFMLVQMPLDGRARYTCGTEEVAGGESVAAILSPHRSVRFNFSSELRQLIVRIDRSAVERAYADHLDALPKSRIDFEPSLDARTPAGQAWRNVVAHIVQGSTAFPELLHRPAYAQRCERMLIDTLLFSHVHNFSDRFDETFERRSVAPAYVRRAAEYMEANVAEVLSVEQVAQVVGVSTRALHYAFRQAYDCTPMGYLLELRLNAVHAELKVCDPVETRLIDLAMQWGFPHYGHFASYYRRRFGEKPQDTLKRRRS